MSLGALRGGGGSQGFKEKKENIILPAAIKDRWSEFSIKNYLKKTQNLFGGWFIGRAVVTSPKKVKW